MLHVQSILISGEGRTRGPGHEDKSKVGLAVVARSKELGQWGRLVGNYNILGVQMSKKGAGCEALRTVAHSMSDKAGKFELLVYERIILHLETFLACAYTSVSGL